MRDAIRPVAGSPHFSLAALAQITFWFAFACFLFTAIGWWALILAPLFVIIFTLLVYERNTRPLMRFVTITWRLGWIGILPGLGYWFWVA